VAATSRDTVHSAIDLLRRAAQKVPRHYFLFAVAGSEEPIYRERVYAYELYHQFRTLMGHRPTFSDPVLSGEVDKQGHPLLRPLKPDLLLHVPGEMGNNLLVVEIKSVNAQHEDIRKDLDSLEYFLPDDGKYEGGAYLVYGGQGRDIDRFEHELSGRRDGPLRRVWLLWHQQPGSLPVVQAEPETG
jgi:hypothetical protein